MDPISAVGLVAAIAQFAEYGRKIVLWSIELYDSGTGALGDNDQLNKFTAEVRNSLDDISKERGNDHWSQGLDTTEKEALETLAKDAKRLAAELLDILASLRMNRQSNSGVGRAVEGLYKSVKTLWRAEDLRNIEERITKLHNQICRRLLMILV